MAATFVAADALGNLGYAEISLVTGGRQWAKACALFHEQHSLLQPKLQRLDAWVTGTVQHTLSVPGWERRYNTHY